MDDKEIINKILSGQEDFFKYIISKYNEKVFKIIYSFCGHRNDCEDIAQSVFIKIFYALKKFKFESSFSTWMYRIVINESITFAKKKHNKVISLQQKISNDSEQEIGDFIKSDDDIEKKALEQETRKIVRDTMLQLKQRYRVILTLRDIEDFSYDEIADIMDVPVERVKVWLFRARNKMRSLLISGGRL